MRTRLRVRSASGGVGVGVGGGFCEIDGGFGRGIGGGVVAPGVGGTTAIPRTVSAGTRLPCPGFGGGRDADTHHDFNTVRSPDVANEMTSGVL
jgi:hypothetical protein|nr:hypothetical protein [Kofleriaceae bacterium]